MTAPRKPGWTDEQVEQVVGNLLRFGVLLAAAVILAGGILYLFQHATEKSRDFSKFNGGVPAYLRGPIDVVQSVFSGDSKGVIQLGILLLIATPVARVVFSVYAFLRERDSTYVIVTLIVLIVLLYSLFSSRLGG